MIRHSSSSAKTASATDVSLAPASVSEDDDLLSLDFTDPGKLAKITAQEDSSSTSDALTLEPWDDALPVVETAVAKPVFPLVRLDTLTEAAVSAYLAGNLPEVRRLLEAALQTDAAHESHWLMLFDAYRSLGDQAAFEQLGLKYLNTFEKSAPTWNNRPVARPAEVHSADRRASVSLTGSLNARCKPQFAKLLEVAQTRSLLKLDLGRLQEVDGGGCALLLETMQHLQQTSCVLELDGAAHLADLLKPQAATGQGKDKDRGAATWLLLLALHQQLGDAEAFEQLALDYAVTFEVSPPSWVEPKKPALAVTSQPVVATGASNAVLRFSGDLLQAGAERFAALEAAGAVNEQVVDFSALQRMDAESAMALRQVLSELPQPHPGVRLLGCHHLLLALLKMAGIEALARIEPKR